MVTMRPYYPALAYGATIALIATTPERVAATPQAHSIRKLAEHRIDAAVPFGTEQFELALGRRLAGFGEFDQRLQEHGFVHAVAVELRAALQAFARDFQCTQREFAHAFAAERQFQRTLRHTVAQRV